MCVHLLLFTSVRQQEEPGWRSRVANLLSLPPAVGSLVEWQIELAGLVCVVALCVPQDDGKPSM
jgi:hypothetical protein